MSAPPTPRIVVIGGGPAGRAAMACLPGATLLARPEATVWHAEPRRLWAEGGDRVWAVAFDSLLLCADEPLLLAAIGCSFAESRLVVDERGATSVPGIFVAGRIRGAVTPEQAVAQARRAADALLRAEPPGSVGPVTSPRHAEEDRLDPNGMAGLLEAAPGAERNAAALAQCALLGPVLPARPVRLAALAALAALVESPPAALPLQQDDGDVA